MADFLEEHWDLINWPKTQDRLFEAGFIGYGTEKAYANSAGRKWLDAHDTLN